MVYAYGKCFTAIACSTAIFAISSAYGQAQSCQTPGPSYSVTDSANFHKYVGRFYAPDGCSGTLISDDLFLTAGHCAVNTAGQPNLSIGQPVRFDFSANSEIPVVTEVLEAVDDGHYDYAVLRLSGRPGARYGFASLSRDPLQPGQETTAIGFVFGADVRGITTGYISADVFPAVDPLKWVSYTHGFGNGQSGSAMFNDRGDIVAVQSKFGCGALVSFNAPANYGSRVAALVNVSPILNSLAKPASNGTCRYTGPYCSNMPLCLLWYPPEPPGCTWTGQ
jgi:hypothetical protein